MLPIFIRRVAIDWSSKKINLHANQKLQYTEQNIDKFLSSSRLVLVLHDECITSIISIHITVLIAS